MSYKLGSSLEKCNLAIVIHVLITSELDYCNVVYVGLPVKTVQKLVHPKYGSQATAGLVTGTFKILNILGIG